MSSFCGLYSSYKSWVGLLKLYLNDLPTRFNNLLYTMLDSLVSIVAPILKQVKTFYLTSKLVCPTTPIFHTISKCVSN